MTNTVQDWIVQLGFDDSQVSKGVKRTQKLLNRISAREAKLAKQKNRTQIKVKKDQDSINLAYHRQINLTGRIDKDLRRLGRTVIKQLLFCNFPVS